MEEAVAKVPELFRSVLREPELFRSVLREQRSSPAKREGAPLPAAAMKQDGDAAVWMGGGAGGLLGGGGVFNKWVEDFKKGTRNRVKGWIIDWDAWCPAWIKSGAKTSYEWWTRERVHKLVENGVPNKDLDLVVFDSMFLFRFLLLIW